MSKKYRHKKKGSIYEKIPLNGFADCTVKQTSDNEWEPLVAYMDVKTYQPFLTGVKRFNEKFELVDDENVIDFYEYAYHEAQQMIESKEDKNLAMLVANLSQGDIGTLRDRIADGIVAGLRVDKNKMNLEDVQ